MGLAACQLAHAYGMKVLGTAGSEEGMRLVEQTGATAFNHNEQGYTEQIMVGVCKPFLLLGGKNDRIILVMSL